MDAWTESLPKPFSEHSRWGQDRAACALDEIAWAMIEDHDHPRHALDRVRNAAAEVRAWRKSLPVDQQDTPLGGVQLDDVRAYLRAAADRILAADWGTGATGFQLRMAEADLRSAGALLERQIAEAF